jgi:alginate O-acetyltransferase complex protein AlgI
LLFNSFNFLIFLPVVFLLDWFVVQKSLKLQNAFLLLASYLFYGWWDWRFLSLIIASSALDYWVGLKLADRGKQSAVDSANSRLSNANLKSWFTGRKKFLAISLVFNLGMLGFFKYFNFFIDSAADLISTIGFQPHLSTLNLILPVGISFYTFQTLSYSIDVYRGKLQPTKDPIAFFTFVAFFPQLVAGPIERSQSLTTVLQEADIRIPTRIGWNETHSLGIIQENGDRG